MAIQVKVPLAAVNTSLQLPITIGIGDVTTAVGTVTLEVRDGQVEDFRPAYAAALREAADVIERSSLDEEEGGV